MPVVDTTRTFANNEQITSTKLNEIMDNSSFVSGAVVPGQGLQVTAGGQMQIGDGSNGVTTAKLADLSVTPAKISTGGPSWTASSVTLPSNTSVSGTVTATGFVGPLTGNVTGSAITSGTSVTASGTSIDFTSVPSWVKRITVMLAQVSSNGTSDFLLQIGDSGGIETTGYNGGISRTAQTGGAVAAWSSGAILQISASAALSHNINISINLIDGSSNTWMISGVGMTSTASFSGVMFAGSKSTSAPLDRIRITTANGIDTFDSGTVNAMYE